MGAGLERLRGSGESAAVSDPYVMNRPQRRIVAGILVFAATCFVAVGGYWWAGWSLHEAVYMVVITISGVGYGEVRPVLSPALQWFTILVILFGMGSGFYVLGTAFRWVVELDVRGVMGARRMKQDIQSLAGHTVICGYGRMGQMLAAELSKTGHPIVIIEPEETRIEEARTAGRLILGTDATEEDALTSAGIERAAVLATTLPSDADNVFITLTARALNPKLLILARGDLPSTEPKLRRAGADHVVLPAAIGGVRMAQIIGRCKAGPCCREPERTLDLNDTLLKLGVRSEEISIERDSVFDGKTVGDVQSHGNDVALVLSVLRLDGMCHVNPDPSLGLKAGDQVLVLRREDDVPAEARPCRGGIKA